MNSFNTRGGGNIIRLFSQTLHGNKPNEVINIRILYMGKGRMWFKYVFVIKVDICYHLWLCHLLVADYDNARMKLMRWIEPFKLMEYWALF